MLTVTLTPTMVTFKNLTDEQTENFPQEYELKWSNLGYFYVLAPPEKLYALLLKLTYTYDIELT